MDEIVLGIESSCDETCAALVRGGRELLCDKIASSAEQHAGFGGVVPEIASRAHLETIVSLIDVALREAACRWEDLSAIAVTQGPGLIGSLLVGVSAAKMLAFSQNLPLVAVHHLAGHIAANYLAFPELEPPFLCLVVSGAHSHLVQVEDYQKFRVLARTRDDAPGEVFDKISRKLNLGYPGGPALDRLARSGRADALQLPRTRFQDSLDFSFSGLKTAVLSELQRASRLAAKRGCPREEILRDEDIAAAFQEALASVLIDRCRECLQRVKADKLVLAGGVSANSALRAKASQLCRDLKMKLYMPPLFLCTDNGAMIAAQGYYDWRDGRRADGRLNAKANLDLENFYAETPRQMWETGGFLF